jgi:hypothetical protein
MTRIRPTKAPIMKRSLLLLPLLSIASPALARSSSAMRLVGGVGSASATFVRMKMGWGMRLGARALPGIAQPAPARIELCGRDGTIRALEMPYGSVVRTANGMTATAEVRDGARPMFRIVDRWSMRGDVLTVDRQVTPLANAAGGFASAVSFEMDKSVSWNDIHFMAPGILYGDPTYDGERSPGGTLAFASHRLMLREDILPAPLFTASFASGASLSILDPTPRGDTTEADTTLASPTIVDRRIRVGAIGARQSGVGPVVLGFSFPGSVVRYGGGRKKVTDPAPTAPAPPPDEVRRYHPIVRGEVDSYRVSFRIAQDGHVPDVTRNAWRWAWNTLHPAVRYLDVEKTQRVLIDHLEAQTATIGGRTAEPFVLSTVSDGPRQWNWTMAGMGFVTKNLECADELLREGDRDPGPRGQQMRKTGLAIIQSMITALHDIPLQATGYDLRTGKPWDHIWLAPWLRNASEDMRALMLAYRREQDRGRPHPEWIAWVRSYCDWLIKQQRADGSFPRRWKPGSSEVAEPSGTTSYAPVPLLVAMARETGDPRFLSAAVRAGDYAWTTWGQRGLFIGGASDNPDITDKEAGMLSMEAYTSLYEATHERKWLDRAQAAADFAESWIWLWNLPMPADADNARLHWKKGVPTTGLQGITALSAGGADEYLDWAVPSYAKLYTFTKDPHYLDVARILLHDTKAMVAMPGRLFDMRGPGWQQENFQMGPGGNGRGVGSHRFWLPWVSANHLHGIMVLQDDQPDLYRIISHPPTVSPSAIQ